MAKSIYFPSKKQNKELHQQGATTPSPPPVFCPTLQINKFPSPKRLLEPLPHLSAPTSTMIQGVSLPQNIQNGTQVQYVHRGRESPPRPSSLCSAWCTATPIIIRPERMVPTFPAPKCLKKDGSPPKWDAFLRQLAPTAWDPKKMPPSPTALKCL